MNLKICTIHFYQKRTVFKGFFAQISIALYLTNKIRIMLPNFFIIGAQKAATSWLVHCLRQHPEIYLPRREIPFFEYPNYGESKIRQFEDIFSDVHNEKAVGLKRPDLLFKMESPILIHNHLPDVKLIAVLRDPVDRAVSSYYWYMLIGIIPLRPLNEGLLKIAQGDCEYYNLSKEIIEAGFYYKQLRRYLHLFDRRQMLIMLYDDIRNEPEKCLKDILIFLDVDDLFEPNQANKRPKSSIYNLFRIRWLNLRNQYIYDYTMADTILKRERNVNLPMKNWLINSLVVAIDRMLLSKICTNNKPELSHEILFELAKIYRKDSSNLAHLLGKDLNNWKSLSIIPH